MYFQKNNIKERNYSESEYMYIISYIYKLLACFFQVKNINYLVFPNPIIIERQGVVQESWEDPLDYRRALKW
jgi:hypothetical protein